MPNPSIAILGLEGSGKTVLMTVLAKKLSMAPDDSCYLDPIGAQTFTRVENTWTALQQGEWPPSTPPGEMAALKWQLYINHDDMKIKADIHLFDLAGQDTRQLFYNDNIQHENRAHLKLLARHLSDASMVLFILNIRDYVAEVNDQRRIENQAVLKSALDQLSHSKKVLLVFTQYDQYEEFITRSGGMAAFCQKYLPYIYNAYLSPKGKVFDNQQIPMVCLSAVNDTQTKIDETGRARQVPAPNFSSRGLKSLCDWLVREICVPYEMEKRQKEKQEQEFKQLQEKRKLELEEEQKKRQLEQKQKKQKQEQEQKKATMIGGMVFGGILGLLIGLIAFRISIILCILEMCICIAIGGISGWRGGKPSSKFPGSEFSIGGCAVLGFLVACVIGFFICHSMYYNYMDIRPETWTNVILLLIVLLGSALGAWIGWVFDDIDTNSR